MRQYDIWSDDEGVWVQVNERAHGPFVTEEKAASRAESISIGGECGCNECLRILGAAMEESDDLVIFELDGGE